MNRFIALFYFLCLNAFTCSTGSVIVLNGTPSAGKSSISHCLEHMLPTSSAFLSIDNYAWKLLMQEALRLEFITEEMTLGEKYTIITNNHSAIAPHSRPLMPNAIQQMYDDCKELALNSQLVVLDTILYIMAPTEIEYFCKQMSNLNVLSVLVYCSPKVVAQHLVERNNNATCIQQHRRAILTMQYFCQLYQTASAENAIDILTQQSVDEAIDIIKQHLLTTETNINELEEKISALHALYYSTFFPNNEDATFITSKNPFDLLVNTGNYSSFECAQIIYKQYTK